MIQIKEKAFKKMKEYVQQMGGTEIGGLLTGKIKGENLIIKDAILLKQEASAATFNIDDSALMELTKNAEPKFLESIIGWWHSHGNGHTFWSATDDETFNRLYKFIGLCFGVVLSNGENKIKTRSKLAIGYNGSMLAIDDIRFEVDWIGKVKVCAKNIQGEIKQKVSTQNFTYKPYEYEKSGLPKTNRASGYPGI